MGGCIVISSSGEPEGALSPIPREAQSYGKDFLPRCHAPARGLGHEQYEQLHICQYQVPLFSLRKHIIFTKISASAHPASPH